MKIIEPFVEIYSEPDHFKKIETIARVCTGTQDKVGTKPDFVENLLKREHMTPFEHVRVKVPYKLYTDCALRHNNNKPPYGFETRFIYNKNYNFENKTVKTNYIVMNGRDFLYCGGTFEELKELKESDDYITVKFVCDIGVSREICRHRQFSFMERSTRYVNMKDGIDFILPVPFEWAKTDKENINKMSQWIEACNTAESQYKFMIEYGCTPQESRSVLPLSTATVLYVTGMISQWKDLLKLRLAKGAHPQMRYIMQMLVDLTDFPNDLKEYAKEIQK